MNATDGQTDGQQRGITAPWHRIR